MQDKNLTDNERWIIETLRSLKPFETIQITADKQGKINHFLVIRSSKIILTEERPIYVA
jgi:hypothetical protein